MLGQGLRQAAAARRLSIAKGTLSRSQRRKGDIVLGARSVSELEAEVARIRNALAQANMELDIIKRLRTLLRSHCQVRVDSQVAEPLSRFRYLSRAGGFSCSFLPLAPASIVTAPTRR